MVHRSLNQSNKETVFAEPEMERSSSSSSSWLPTLTIQLSLCFALYVVINLGHPQNLLYKLQPSPASEEASDHFNNTPIFSNWYTTGGSKRDGLGCFLQQIKLPGGRMLDIVGLNTTSLQDTALVGPSSGTRDGLSNWLTRKLKATISSWRIVVGFHPLVPCDEDGEQSVAKLINEPLHRIFVKFGVNVYLSQQGCTSYALRGSVAYIGNPGLTKQKSLSDSANERYQATKEMTDGFLLHRLNSLEMVTYFVTSAGELLFNNPCKWHSI